MKITSERSSRGSPVLVHMSLDVQDDHQIEVFVSPVSFNTTGMEDCLRAQNIMELDHCRGSDI